MNEIDTTETGVAEPSASPDTSRPAPSSDDTLSAMERHLEALEKRANPTPEDSEGAKETASPEPEAPAPADAKDGEDGVPSLDAELAKNPVLAKRWAEMTAGVTKVVEGAKEAKAEAQRQAEALGALVGDPEAAPRVRAMNDWAILMDDPEHVHAAFYDLGEKLMAHHKATHGKDLQLFAKPEAPALGATFETAVVTAVRDKVGDPMSTEGWEQEGFDSPGEFRAYKRARAETIRDQMEREWRAQATPAPPAKKAAGADEIDAYVTQIADRTIAEAKLADQGWPITSEMIAEALRAHPTMRNEPMKAVRARFAEERLQWRLAQRDAEAKPPVAAPGSSARVGNPDIPPPGSRSLSDIAKLHGISVDDD